MMVTIACCASSTCLSLTGPIKSISSFIISAIRLDMLENIKSETSGVAPLRATVSCVFSTSLIILWMAVESRLMTSSNTNIFFLISSASSASDSSRFSMMYFSVPLSTELSISTMASIPPAFV